MQLQLCKLREGVINTLRGGCANLASFDPKMLTPPKNGNIGLDPPKKCNIDSDTTNYRVS